MVMKNLKNIFCVCAPVLALLAAGCAALLEGPELSGAKAGTVTLTIDGESGRTAFPGIGQFEKILLSIAGQEGAEDLPDADAAGGTATVEFPEPGSWTITAKAWINAGDENPAALSEGRRFVWDGETVTGDTRFVLEPAGTGPGTLLYTVSLPEGLVLGQGSRIRVEQDGALLGTLNEGGFAGGVRPLSAGETDQALSLAPGRYAVDILLIKDNGDAVLWRESVVILPGLITRISFAPEAEDFLAPREQADMTGIAGLEFNTTLANTNSIYVGELLGADGSYTLAVEVPAEVSPAYFTLTKPAGHSVAVAGTTAVAMLDPGAHMEGSTAGDGLAVFRVDTSSVMAEGGDIAFALTITEEGRAAVEVAVTVSVQTPFIPLLWVDSSSSSSRENLSPLPDQDSITDLSGALAWLAANAVNKTKYVVKLNADSEMTGSFVSKTGSSGVRITLRGIGRERTIYTQSALAASGLFEIKAGTTLALDKNITLNGNDTPLTGSGLYFVYINGGILETKQGAKITGFKGTHVVNITASGVFRMYESGILENACDAVVVYVQSGSFEMRAGAKISGNTLTPAATEANAGAVQRGNVAAVSVSSSASFIMYGGEISGANYRGVYLAGYKPLNSSAYFATFVMEGGSIINNGNSALAWEGERYYPRGGGVYIDSYARFTMTGGEISGNGDPSAPGSGVFCALSSITAVPDAFTLNGPVIIKNTIGFEATAASYSCPRIGSAFVLDDPVAVDLCIADPPIINFSVFWLSRQFLYAASGQAIAGNPALAAKFAPVQCYIAATASGLLDTTYVDIPYRIDDDGRVAKDE
jgi:hypothetical protein